VVEASAGSAEEPVMTGPALFAATGLLLAAAVQFGVTTGRTGLAALAGGLAVAALFHRRRFRIGSAGEVLVLLALGIGGMGLHGVDPNAVGQASAPLRSSMFIFAFAGLGAAALRLHLDRPEGGLAATVAAAGVVFLACGTVRTGSWLPRLFAIYLLLSLVALALEAWQRGDAPAPWRLRGRHAWVSALLLVSIPVAMWGWANTGPGLIRSGASYMLDRLGQTEAVGFHDGPISLHALDGLLDSDEVVLRIDGPTPTHLRGNVYVHYTHGRWKPPPRDASADAPALGRAMRQGSRSSSSSSSSSSSVSNRVSSIEYVGREGRRFFLPLGARPHALEPDGASIDEWHIVRSLDGAPERAQISWPPARAEMLAPPGEEDLRVPDELREPLASAAVQLGGSPGDSPAEWARDLASGLASTFEYSISFRDAFASAQRARPRVDPVLLFLEDVREGHCEYFASSLTLMLRTHGIPARMVTGYRVAEYNPIGGYAIVRERHAHAWVEAHLPGEGWVTLDGTPMALAMNTGLIETSRLAAVFDWLSREIRRHGSSLLLVLLVVGLASVQIVRLVRGRRLEGRAQAPGRRQVSLSLRRLLEKLEGEGFDRDTAESLESLARRLRNGSAVDSDGARADETIAWLEAADLLDRYAAHRYGDLGDWGSLVSDLAAWPAQERGDGPGSSPQFRHGT